MQVAIVGVAAVINLESQGGACKDARIVLGSVAPTPIRSHQAEEVLRGEKIDTTLLERAAQAVSEEACPISDGRSSAEYRTEMVRVFAKRAITAALEVAKVRAR